MIKDSALVVFQDKNIRRIWHAGEWYFSVVDIISVLVESSDARKYWNKLSQRLREEGSESVTNCHQLKLISADGKYYATDCANTKMLFRIVQSIPSKHAEPFKQWLAQVGYDRVLEIENPELAQQRARTYFEQKGYPQDWIDTRLKGIAVRQDLTNEWKQRGVQEGKEYAILTNEIAKATFGVGITEHKQIKDLDITRTNQHLRDHMTNLELIFTMLGEASTTEIAKTADAQGFTENKRAAKKGGKIAGDARENLEKETGKTVVSKKNALEITKKKNLKL